MRGGALQPVDRFQILLQRTAIRIERNQSRREWIPDRRSHQTLHEEPPVLAAERNSLQIQSFAALLKSVTVPAAVLHGRIVEKNAVRFRFGTEPSRQVSGRSDQLAKSEHMTLAGRDPN